MDEKDGVLEHPSREEGGTAATEASGDSGPSASGMQNHVDSDKSVENSSSDVKKHSSMEVDSQGDKNSKILLLTTIDSHSYSQYLFIKIVNNVWYIRILCLRLHQIIKLFIHKNKVTSQIHKKNTHSRHFVGSCTGKWLYKHSE